MKIQTSGPRAKISVREDQRLLSARAESSKNKILQSSSALLCCDTGGGGGIRTHEGLSSLPVFKTGAFNHSATPPTQYESSRFGDWTLSPRPRLSTLLKFAGCLKDRGAQPGGGNTRLLQSCYFSLQIV